MQSLHEPLSASCVSGSAGRRRRRPEVLQEPVWRGLANNDEDRRRSRSSRWFFSSSFIPTSPAAPRAAPMSQLRCSRSEQRKQKHQAGVLARDSRSRAPHDGFVHGRRHAQIALSTAGNEAAPSRVAPAGCVRPGMTIRHRRRGVDGRRPFRPDRPHLVRPSSYAAGPGV
jgi:hypothetical protein